MKEMSHRFVFVGLFLCAIATSTYAQAAPDAILCWSSRILGSRQRIIVDLRLKSDSGNRQPSSEDVGAIAALGGTVLYRFNVAVLRASLDTAALRQLLGAKNRTR